MKSIEAEQLKTIESIRRARWMLTKCDRKVDWTWSEIMRRTKQEIYRQDSKVTHDP